MSQHVVEEAVVLVPERDALAAEVVGGVRDVEEVLEELRRHVLVATGCCCASSSAIASMFRQYIAIQLVASDCARRPPSGSGRGAVEEADVVEAEEAALEDVQPVGVLAVHPPG